MSKTLPLSLRLGCGRVFWARLAAVCGSWPGRHGSEIQSTGTRLPAAHRPPGQRPSTAERGRRADGLPQGGGPDRSPPVRRHLRVAAPPERFAVAGQAWARPSRPLLHANPHQRWRGRRGGGRAPSGFVARLHIRHWLCGVGSSFDRQCQSDVGRGAFGHGLACTGPLLGAFTCCPVSFHLFVRLSVSGYTSG